VVSCSGAFGNQGCNGGWPVNAYKYIQANPLCTSAQYPYTSGTTTSTGTCNKNIVSQCTNGGSLTSYNIVPANNCGALEAAVATQPISVCVDASTWSYYKTGVFSNCGTQLDHCVLAVGYNEGNYWIIQNSWGTSWGQSGFIWLKWGNTCGVCQQAQYATAK
jgi:C1A family cysteine protease